MKRKHEIIEKALEVRHANGITLIDPCNPFEIARREGLDIRYDIFEEIEGAYDGEKTILINTARPIGRKAFTCAHELGHFYLKHPLQRKKSFESEAQLFAGFLLMPKTAINHALIKRRANPTCPQSIDIYQIATWFGIGYESLLIHIEKNFKTIFSSQNIKKLKRQSPKDIKSDLGIPNKGEVKFVDEHWGSQSIILQTDSLLLINEIFFGKKIIKINFDPKYLILNENKIYKCENESFFQFTPIKRGQTKIELDNGANYNIMISEEKYIGRYHYIYLADD